MGVAALAAAWGAPAIRRATSRSAARLTSSAKAAATPSAELTTVAQWPARTFLENLKVRADGSFLVSALNTREVWYVSPPAEGTPARKVLVHTFDQPPFDFQEPSRDVFIVNASTYNTTLQSFLYRLDLRDWEPGAPAPVQQLLQFPSSVSAVDGSCSLRPDVLLVVDAVGLIWRVDLANDGRSAVARVWLRDPSMSPGPPVVPPQPGINGIKYSSETGYVYYTSTHQRLFMRVRVDPATLNPASAPELLTSGYAFDDFDIDVRAGVAYITTHRDNSLVRASLDSSMPAQVVAGQPFDPELAGPSAFVWGRGRKDFGSVGYMTSDGGVTQPPADGIVRPAKLLRIVLPDSYSHGEAAGSPVVPPEQPLG
jgi:hypothetical protein